MFIYVLMILAQCVIFGYATQYLINRKGYQENWFWWGFFFWMVALVVAAGIPNNFEAENDQGLVWNEKMRDRRMLQAGGWKCEKCAVLTPPIPVLVAVAIQKRKIRHYLPIREKINQTYETVDNSSKK